MIHYLGKKKVETGFLMALVKKIKNNYSSLENNATINPHNHDRRYDSLKINDLRVSA